MNEREKETTQKALDLLTEIIDVTEASGSEKSNHIIGLKLIDRKGAKNMFGKPIRDGLFVRPVWSDSPDRSDGYYDICVEGDSPWCAVWDTFNNLKNKF